MRLLDPDVVVRADAVAVGMAAARASAGAPELSEEMHGVDAVTRVFAGGAKAARLTLVDGLAGAVVSVGGPPMAAFGFTLRDGRIAGIDWSRTPRPSPRSSWNRCGNELQQLYPCIDERRKATT